MWRIGGVLTVALMALGGIAADREVVVREPNYDKAKIAPYMLEDPLTFLDGRKVTKENWAARRKEILGIFAKEMYGAEPPPPEALVTELVDEKGDAAAGFAIRRQYRMWFKADKSGPAINWIVWIPRYAKKPVPVISFLNYQGNHELVSDADIPLPDVWLRAQSDGSVENNRPVERRRGAWQNPNNNAVLPLGEILARGYAVMSACYGEISRDPWPGEDAYDRVFTLWGERDPKRTDDITALGAWGWALCRGLDLAERIPEIDAKRSVVTGYSRLGKAALIAAARDERFAVCVPNQTGGGGAPLAKRDYGENISTENRNFPHWYCRAYAKYAADPAKLLTFDQHLFLACVVPRALLVEGFDEPWFDTEGEYLAVQAASPVWALLTGGGMPKVAWPDDFDTSAIGARLGYVRRSGSHGLAAVDWKWLLDFADGVLKAPDLRVGVISDVHVPVSGLEKLRQAYALFDRRKVDAVLVCGDLTNYGLVRELEQFRDVWRSAFPGNRRSDGGEVVPLFIYGDHDTGGYMHKFHDGEPPCRLHGIDKATVEKEQIVNVGSGKAWREAFGEDWDFVQVKTVKGYRFILSHYYGTIHQETPPGLARRFAEATAGLDAKRPFFFVQHRVFPGTVDAFPWEREWWCADGAASKELLANHPNAIALCGHAHSNLLNEGNFWQGGFTAVEVPSLHELGLPRATGDRKAKDNASVQCLIMNVWPDGVTFERLDARRGGPIAPDWSVPVRRMGLIGAKAR